MQNACPCLPLVALALALGPVAWGMQDSRRNIPRGEILGGQTRGDGFGWALAPLPDDRLAVGAPHPGGEAHGQVSVHQVGRARPLFTLFGEHAGDLFGAAVLSGFDWDGDGHADLAVGAPGTRVDGEPVGRVWIHCGLSGIELARIDGRRANGHFGTALALLPESLPGSYHLLVGAPGEMGAEGAVRIFEVGSGAPVASVVGRGAGTEFGTSIAVIGDITGDGQMDFVVGAPGDSRRGPAAGAAEVIDGRTLRRHATRLGRAPKERFGERVAALGDVNGDRVPDYAVSAPSATAPPKGAGEDTLPAKVDAGRVDVFAGRTGDRLGSLWGQAEGEFFGRALLGGFDWNGKGVPSLAVGTPYAALPGRGSRRSAGSVRILCAGTMDVLDELHPRGTDEHFGAALSLMEGRAGTRLAIGMPRRGETDPPGDALEAGGVRILRLPSQARRVSLPRPVAREGPSPGTPPPPIPR